MPNLQSLTTVSSTNDKTIAFVSAVEGTSVDGPGLRTSLYFAGCHHRCPGCHNPETWDVHAGKLVSVEELMELVRYNDFDVTFSGGDPLYQAAALFPLAKAIKEFGKTIWCYTGFTYEEIMEGKHPEMRELLGLIDVVVDGPFIEGRKQSGLRFRGSDNQRIIDLNETRCCGKVMLWRDGDY